MDEKDDDYDATRHTTRVIKRNREQAGITEEPVAQKIKDSNPSRRSMNAIDELSRKVEEIAAKYSMTSDELLSRYQSSRFQEDTAFLQNSIDLIASRSPIAASKLKGIVESTDEKRTRAVNGYCVKQKLSLTYDAFESLRNDLSLIDSIAGRAALKDLASE